VKRARILLADDHALVVAAFQRLLEGEHDVVGVVADGEELLSEAPRLRPDVILLDVHMPKLNGIDAARKLKKVLPGARVVFLTSNEDPILAADAIAGGAAGYLLKSSAVRELLLAIEAALAGKTFVTPSLAAEIFAAAGARGRPSLTPRQREVLQLLVEGKTMKAIARKLGVSTSTVAHHKYAMMETLGIKTSAELIQYAIRKGF